MSQSSPMDYFHRVTAQMPTRMWINNATTEQARFALKIGAVAATTNPTYPARLLKEDPDYINGLIDSALQVFDDDDKVAERVYREAVSALQAVFLPLFEESKGQYGYVAVQGDPRVNHDADAIVESALEYFQLGENIIVKVPSAPAGAEAMSKLVSMGHPTIATLSFSIDQCRYMAEAYDTAVKAFKAQPPCYVTFIAGILEDYLMTESSVVGDVLPIEWIRQAGCAATRRAYRLYKERGYGAILLGGGARGTRHFSDLVGGDLAITIGPELAQQLIDSNERVVSCIDEHTPENVITALEEHLPDFRKAYRPNSMRPEEFSEFGPVAGFQQSFLSGIDTLLKAIATRRGSVTTTVS